MPKRVFLLTRDLVFRGKLRGVVSAAGGEVTRDPGEADLLVVELDADGWEDRLRDGIARGMPVLAFGSHVNVDLLRAARALGADAVPNSQIEVRLAALVQAPA
jgi:hypothetical protein